MAITINNQPEVYSPVYQPMMYLITSTEAGNDNFKLKFTIAITADGESYSRTVQVSPRPDGKIEFDISKHLQDYIDYNSFDIEDTSVSRAGHIVYYTTTLTEEWTVSGVSTFGTPMVLTDNRASNVVLNRQEISTFDEALWHNKEDAIPVATAKVLLNRELIYKDDIYWLNVVGSADDLPRKVRVRQLDNAGTLLATDIVTLSDDSDDALFARIDLSTFTFDADATAVTLEVTNNSDQLLTARTAYELEDRECTPYDQVKFIYMDKLGSYNCINLDFKGEKDLTVDRVESYRQNTNNFSSSVGRGDTRFFVDASEEFTANTDNLSPVEIKQVEDLLLSNRVFLDVRDNTTEWSDIDFVPVEILTKKMRYFKRENQDLAQYTISYKYSFQKNVR